MRHKNASTADGRWGLPWGMPQGRPIAMTLCAVLTALSLGCGSRTVRKGVEPAACAVLDSLYRTSGFEKPLIIQGKATIDANQHRIRGKIRVDADSPRRIIFEFTSSILFGSRREDFVFSLVADTLRIIDRERGAYYEGTEAEDVLRESLEADFPVASVLALALGGHPPCGDFDALSYKLGSGGEVIFTGRHLGCPLRVVFAAGSRRLERISWPVLSPDDDTDQLEVEYDWQPQADGKLVLREVVMGLETKQWRCKIRSAGEG
jgi:hypothetical protein